MATNYTPLVDGQDGDAATFNAVFQQIDDEIEDIKDGTSAMSAPDITSFANSGHDHSNAANGGQIGVSAIDSGVAADGTVLTADGAGGSAFEVINGVPTGVLFPYAGSSAPSGWLLCDGSAVSRATYATLFALISTTYGAGDGSTTFNLPDLRGRVPGGLDNMGGTSANRVTDAQADSLGGSMGAETHTLTESEMPSHSHDTHTEVDLTYDGGPSPRVRFSAASPIAGAIANTGGDGAHNNMQPTLFFNYIIRT